MNYYYDIKVSRHDIGTLLNDHRKEKKFTDVQLQVGNKLFDTHRAVLSLYSPVLKAAFSENWTHSKIYPLSEEHVDAEILEDVLSYLYVGSIRLTPDNAHSICMAANFLQIPDLLYYSVNYLCQLITVENVLTLFQFSISCDLERLRYCCLLIIKGRESVLQSSQILEFSFEDFKNLIVGLKEAFADSVLRERSFQSIVRWTEKNCSKRLEHLLILLKNIPLEELSPDFLTNTVSEHPLVKGSISCAQAVSTTMADLRICQKAQPKQNLIVVNFSKWGGSTMTCYDFRTGLCKQLPDKYFQDGCFGATVINQQNIIFSCGYEDAKFTEMTDSMEMFEWNEQTWTKLPKMPIALKQSMICAHDGHLYVAGKQENKNALDLTLSVLCYSFETRQWKEISSLISNRVIYQLGHLISADEHLYYIDFYGEYVERYDPAQDQWTRSAIRPTQLNCWYRFAATFHEKKIYLCGQDGFYVYDPAADIWTELPSPKNICNTSLVSLNGRLLVAGGHSYGDPKPTDLIQEFDLSTREWNKFGKLPSAHYRPYMVVGNFY